jgi:hypothetical protein
MQLLVEPSDAVERDALVHIQRHVGPPTGALSLSGMGSRTHMNRVWIVNAAIRPARRISPHLGVADEPVRLPWIASRRSPLTCVRESNADRRCPRDYGQTLRTANPVGRQSKCDSQAEQSGPSCGCGRARACGPETARRGQCRRNRTTTTPGRHAGMGSAAAVAAAPSGSVSG